MGKQQRAASATDNADILTQVKTALKDESVITQIADRIASAVANTIIQRLDKLEAEKNKKICHLEQTLVELEDKVDKLKQFSRRTSIRISGINENPVGENIETIVKRILVNMDVQDKINMQNIDRVHRIGQIKTTNTSNRPRQIIVKFKDYSSKDTGMKNRKLLRVLRRSNNHQGLEWENSRHQHRKRSRSWQINEDSLVCATDIFSFCLYFFVCWYKAYLYLILF